MHAFAQLRAAPFFRIFCDRAALSWSEGMGAHNFQPQSDVLLSGAAVGGAKRLWVEAVGFSPLRKSGLEELPYCCRLERRQKPQRPSKLVKPLHRKKSSNPHIPK